MGTRTLVSSLALLAAFSAQAASPTLPPPKLAELSLRVTTPVAHPLTPVADQRVPGEKAVANDARWLNERQPFVQEQRWVF